MTQPDANSTSSSLTDFELLAEVSQLLTLTDLDSVLEKVIALTARAVGAAKTSIFLHDQEGDNWERLLITRNLDPKESLEVVQRVLDEGLAGWVLRNQQGTIVEDTKTDPRWHVFPNDTYAVRSALCLPLLQGGQVIAVITMVHPEPHHFSDHHLRLMTIVFNQVAVALRNAQLFGKMQDQRRQLEAVLHALPDVLFVVSEDGRVLLANAPATQLLGGMAAHEIVGGSMFDLLDTDSVLQPLKDILSSSPRSGQHWSYEKRSEHLRKDLLVTVSSWANPFDTMAGYVIVMRDITTQRDLSRFKGEMLKMANHDLRSPLALIVGYCDLIALDITDPRSPTADYLEVIRRSTERMTTLLDDLLRVEEIRNSPAEMHKPFEFAEALENVVEHLTMLASAKNQQVTVQVDTEHLPTLVGNPMLIREAMENLVTNAVKYTPDGGAITVTSYVDGERLHYIVEDNGIGIAEDELPRVFGYGYRATRDGVAEPGGWGIGLSLVKTIVEHHNGEVWAESTKGVGSRFGFWLPLPPDVGS